MTADPFVLSAANTLAAWRTRRLAKGRHVSTEDMRARVREMWPAVDDVEAIVRLAKRPASERATAQDPGRS